MMPARPITNQISVVNTIAGEPIKIEGVLTSMLHALYIAKCKDLMISHNNREQEFRFIQYCAKTIKNRSI